MTRTTPYTQVHMTVFSMNLSNAGGLNTPITLETRILSIPSPGTPVPHLIYKKKEKIIEETTRVRGDANATLNCPKFRIKHYYVY